MLRGENEGTRGVCLCVSTCVCVCVRAHECMFVRLYDCRAERGCQRVCCGREAAGDGSRGDT